MNVSRLLPLYRQLCEIKHNLGQQQHATTQFCMSIIRNLSSCFLHPITTHDRIEFRRTAGSTDQYTANCMFSACHNDWRMAERRVVQLVLIAATPCTQCVVVGLLKNSTIPFRRTRPLLWNADSVHASECNGLLRVPTGTDVLKSLKQAQQYISGVNTQNRVLKEEAGYRHDSPAPTNLSR